MGFLRNPYRIRAWYSHLVPMTTVPMTTAPKKLQKPLPRTREPCYVNYPCESEGGSRLNATPVFQPLDFERLSDRAD